MNATVGAVAPTNPSKVVLSTKLPVTALSSDVLRMPTTSSSTVAPALFVTVTVRPIGSSVRRLRQRIVPGTEFVEGAFGHFDVGCGRDGGEVAGGDG